MEPASGERRPTSGERPSAPGAGPSRACEHFRGRLQDLLDDRAGSDALAGDAHALGCASCREALAALATLDGLLARQPAAEPPPGFAASVIRAIEADAARATRRARASVLVGLAAAVALGIGLDFVGGSLRAGFAGLLEDARAFARVAGARADSLQLDDVRGFELPAVPSLPGAPGSLATLALVGAAGVVAGELVWWRRARRVGGQA